MTRESSCTFHVERDEKDGGGKEFMIGVIAAATMNGITSDGYESLYDKICDVLKDTL